MKTLSRYGVSSPFQDLPLHVLHLEVTRPRARYWELLTQEEAQALRHRCRGMVESGYIVLFVLGLFVCLAGAGLAAVMVILDSVDSARFGFGIIAPVLGVAGVAGMFGSLSADYSQKVFRCREGLMPVHRERAKRQAAVRALRAACEPANAYATRVENRGRDLLRLDVAIMENLYWEQTRAALAQGVAKPTGTNLG
jgi:hypothetical protein